MLAPAGRSVKLDSFSYSIEYYANCAYDSLNIYDGSGTNDTRIARLCGSGTTHDVQSTENVLFLTQQT